MSIGLLIGMLGLVSACGGEEDVGQTEEGELVLGAAEVEQVNRRGVIPGDRTLVFEGFSGRIELDGTPDSTANLTFYKQARGRDDEAARSRLGQVSIRESGDGETYQYVMRSDTPDRSEVRVRGTVPQDVPLRIQMENGPVSLAGVQGPITIETSSGPVQVTGATRSVDVSSRNSTIQVGMRAVPANGSVNLTTSNGDLLLVLPSGSSAEVQAQTDAGQVRVEGLNFTSRRLDPQGAGASFEGTLGQGNASITLRTQNGSITLREGMGTELMMEADTLQSGQPEEAIEEGLAPQRPVMPRDSLQRARPQQTDTSTLRPQATDTSQRRPF